MKTIEKSSCCWRLIQDVCENCSPTSTNMARPRSHVTVIMCSKHAYSLKRVRSLDDALVCFVHGDARTHALRCVSCCCVFWWYCCCVLSYYCYFALWQHAASISITSAVISIFYNRLFGVEIMFKFNYYHCAEADFIVRQCTMVCTSLETTCLGISSWFVIIGMFNSVFAYY